MNKVLLMILDGWGIGKHDKTDAIFNTPTPFMNSLSEKYPHAQLLTCGENVGLPDGQMGNSEVGHLNIGAGRVVNQDLVRINKACRDNSIMQNPEIVKAFTYARDNKKQVHFMGLVSDGGVHSSLEHLKKLCDVSKEFGIAKTFVHCFMDGRDTDPKSGLGFIRELKAHMDKSTGRIDQYFGMLVQRKFLHGGPDHMAQDVPAQFRQGQFILMLAGYHHCGNAVRDSRAVFHRHLCLAVRTQAGDDVLPAGIGQQAGQSMGQHHRQGQQLLCFIAGKAVQDSLISCAGLRAATHSFRNVGTLLMGDDLHLIVTAAVSGFPHRPANNGRDIRNLRCRDLACGDDLDFYM